MFIVEMRNKNAYWIDEHQAKVVDQSWANRQPVKVNGVTINTVDISNIVPEDQWYELHPELKPVPVKKEVKYIEPAKTENTEAWMECFKRNRKLISEGQLPRWIVENGELVQRDDYWRDGVEKSDSVRGLWVKKRVSKRKWESYYSQAPNYQLLEDDGSDVVIAFVTVEQPIPHHLLELDTEELSKIRG